MNTSIQCIASSPELTAYFISRDKAMKDTFNNDFKYGQKWSSTNGKVAAGFKELLTMMYKKNDKCL
jgi:hypothetical protein